MARVNQAMEDLLRYNAAILPQKRSIFDKSHSHTTTCDSGYIIPLMWDRVVPGDEKQIRYSGLARMATPIHPVMDEAKLDVACFFVPDRLVWEHAREFYGENKDASFNPDGEYTVPYLVPSQYTVNADERYSGYGNGIGSLSDYLGMPAFNVNRWMNLRDNRTLDDVPEYRVDALLWRDYHIIYDYFYRNSSVQQSEQLSKGDIVTQEEWSVISKLKKACKFPDYFTSLLREPQAGDDVFLPLGDKAPVVTGDNHENFNNISMNLHSPVGFNDDYRHVVAGGDDSKFGQVRVTLSTESGQTVPNIIQPGNLWAELTSVSAATINNLRAAITVQQLLEIDSMAGKRYQQILQAHFGVFTPDATLQQPELLGLTRTSIGMRQVLQTSSSNDTSPQGNTAAFSVTNVSNEWICNKSFTEPGYILVLGVIRPVHSYSQGIDPLLRQLNRYDKYWPVFDNLGNQPVDTVSIYASGTGEVELNELKSRASEVFGYSEAWTEYRIKQNRVSGLMRPDVSGTLASWNYSSDFDDIPVLNSDFVEEDPNLLDRTIAVTSEPQFIIDSYFDYKDTKNMSVHSVPGLVRL